MALYLTTDDNPFSPVDDYEQWSKFDRDHGYNTDSLVALVQLTSTSLKLSSTMRLMTLFDGSLSGILQETTK